MTTYRKSMSEALNQVYLGEDNMALLKKAAGGSAQKLKMKDGKVTMDSFTASAIMQVYKAINPKNKKTMENVVNTGTITALQKLQALAMRSIKSGYEVEHDGEELDEAKTHFVYQRDVAKTKSIVHRGDEKSSREWIKNNSKHYDHKGKNFDIYKGKPGNVSPRDIVKEEVELGEDGHTDVASAVRKCMTITEDAQDINSKLRTMSTEDSLPSWWTNKLAVASNDMNKMRDYIVNPVQEEVELDEGTWELPRTSKQKAGLKKALSKPIKLGKEGETARNVIGPFIGDDELFDDLMDAGDENPKSDARPIIKKAMKRLGIKEEVELDEVTMSKALDIDPKDVDRMKTLAVLYTRAMKLPAGSPKQDKFKKEIQQYEAKCMSLGYKMTRLLINSVK